MKYFLSLCFSSGIRVLSTNSTSWWIKWRTVFFLSTKTWNKPAQDTEGERIEWNSQWRSWTGSFIQNLYSLPNTLNKGGYCKLRVVKTYHRPWKPFQTMQGTPYILGVRSTSLRIRMRICLKPWKITITLES